MSTVVVAIVLFAAFLHAAWNAAIKVGENKFFNTVLVTSGAGFVCALVLPFVSQPERASWAYILASVVLQVVYFCLLAAAYRVGDMSQAYPLMRGTAPLLVAVVVAVLSVKQCLPCAGWAWACWFWASSDCRYWTGHRKSRRATVFRRTLWRY
ncbi:hypothetical protein ACO0LM_06495 [Undibacterium sp. Di26W]|uniref:hypothetical protein n=1 Tax=Undibacterium sp. Di26W TaxID=3413035 RepID=UPI003BEF771C